MEDRLAAAGPDVDDDTVVLEAGPCRASRRRTRASASPRQAGTSPTSRNVSTCRSGRTSRCVGACGAMSRIATKPVRRVDVVALADEPAEEAVRRQAATASTPSSETPDRACACTNVPDARVDEPGRVVVARSRGPADRRGRGPSCRPSAAQRRAAERRPRGARSRAPRSRFTAAGTLSSAAVRVPGRGEYGKTCTFVIPSRSHERERPLEGGLVLGREADDHVGRQVEVPSSGLEPAHELRDRVAPAHRSQHPVVARLQRHVEVRRDGRRLAQRRDQLVVDVVDLDRGEPQALAARRSRRPRGRAARACSRPRGRGSSPG